MQYGKYTGLISFKVSINLLCACSVLFLQLSCKKQLQVNAPITSISDANVFSSDATAIAVLTGLYAKISSSSVSSGGSPTSMSLFLGLSADELKLHFTNSTNYNAYYKNSLSVTTAGYEYWNSFYPYIFSCNSAIEGLSNSNGLTDRIKQQLLGEAKFMRALFYFYLVNLYGDIPLVTTTDYQVNSILGRTKKDVVYQQIISDLKDAELLLGSEYLDGSLTKITTERVRPNKYAATSLLARVYLYNGEYGNAETKATSVIGNSSVYRLTTLDSAFLKNSKEAIWQLQPVVLGRNTEEAWIFILPPSGPTNDPNYPVYLSEQLLNRYDSGDLRKTYWTKSVTAAGRTFYYPYKYKSATLNSPVTEYSTVLRIAEQFLIRAESRVKLGNIVGGMSDLNAIRTRAGLPNINSNSTEAELLLAILRERQVEFSTEWGHRWLDLKRTNKVDEVMNVVTSQKGGVWNKNWQWYPIPTGDIEKDPNIVQNFDY